MKYKLLQWLACPRCGRPDLRIDAFRIDTEQSPVEVRDGILTCAGCLKMYPVVAGVPRMLPDSFNEHYSYLSALSPAVPKAPATDGDSAEFRRLNKSTQESFGFEWLRYQVTDFAENVEFFRQTMGISPGDLTGKLVLEAGCGMGRFLEVAASRGAEVVGIDLSRSVERAWSETSFGANLHVLQADIMRPPFRRHTFDNIYSIGVLHHTPNTRQAFQALCPLLCSGGRISIWIYRTFQPEIKVAAHKRAFASVTGVVSDGSRLITTKLPHRVLHYLCYLAIPIGFLKRKVDENRLLRYVFWPIILLPVSTHRKWQVRVCDTFDWLSPKFQWKHTTPEVVQWFKTEGLTQVQSFERSVSVTGFAPASCEARAEGSRAGLADVRLQHPLSTPTSAMSSG